MWKSLVRKKPRFFQIVPFWSVDQYNKEKERIVGWLALARLLWIKHPIAKDKPYHWEMMNNLGLRLSEYKPTDKGFFCDKPTAEAFVDMAIFMEKESKLEPLLYMESTYYPSLIDDLVGKLKQALKRANTFF